MFDFKSIVKDSQLTVHFENTSEADVINAVDNVSGNVIGSITLSDGTFNADNDETFMQYKLWQTRPERKVGKKISILGKNLEELIEEYEELFIGAYIMQTKRPVEATGNFYERALEWLRTTDFYSAPASTRYHDSVPGGLLLHCIKVYNHIVDLLTLPVFKDVKVEEATLAALMHDWCKINYYEAYQKNVKDENTGTWIKETAYRVNQKGMPLGHGATSMFLASRVLTLTIDQALAIRWHMGRYNVSDKEENEFQKAVNDCPMVYLIQIADQLACNDYAIHVSEGSF